MTELRFHCLECGEPAGADYESGKVVSCGRCQAAQTLHEGAIVAERVVVCPICKTEELYVQKDFPERVGMLLVALGTVLAMVAWAYYSPLATFGVLFLFFGVDALLFYTRKNVTVCYRCLCQIRGMEPNETHHAFDLAIGERYRQERLRRRERQEPLTR